MRTSWNTNLPLESTTGAYSAELMGPILLCHKTFPEEASSANTKALTGIVTYKQPLFPEVIVNILPKELKSWTQL